MRETIVDELLATLVYDSKFNVFRGWVDFEDTRTEIDVRFSSPPDQISELEIAAAREAYLALVNQKTIIEDAVISEYLDLYNKSWRDGELISREQFHELLKPENINIDYGHLGAVWYAAGDLFTDHSIEVLFKDDGSIDSTSLAG